jgi:hypothetical protein
MSEKLLNKQFSTVFVSTFFFFHCTTVPVLLRQKVFFFFVFFVFFSEIQGKKLPTAGCVQFRFRNTDAYLYLYRLNMKLDLQSFFGLHVT